MEKGHDEKLIPYIRSTQTGEQDVKINRTGFSYRWIAGVQTCIATSQTLFTAFSRKPALIDHCVGKGAPQILCNSKM